MILLFEKQQHPRVGLPDAVRAMRSGGASRPRLASRFRILQDEKQ